MTNKKTSKETQNPEARAKKDDEKLEPKEQIKEHEAKNGEEGDSAAKEKEVLQPNTGGFSNTYIVPIALLLSITALVISIMFAMSSKRAKLDGEKLEVQQIQLTEKLESSLENLKSSLESSLENLKSSLESSRAKMESAFPRLENLKSSLESSRVKMESAFPRLENLESSLESSRVKMETAFPRLENIESKIAELNVNGETERGKRAIIEYQKALLSIQAALSLLSDDDKMRMISDIENVMKSSVVQPVVLVEKETEVETKETDDALTSEAGEEPAPDEKELEEKIAESEIGKEEERKKAGEIKIVAVVGIDGPEQEKEEAGTEVQSSGTEERIEEKISEETTEPLLESVEEEISLSEEQVKAE